MLPCPMLVRLLERPPGRPADEVTGAGYRPQVALFDAGVDGWAVLAEPVTFTGVPAHLAIGVEVTDRADVWQLPTVVPVLVPDGAEVVIPAGALRVLLAAGRA